MPKQQTIGRTVCRTHGVLVLAVIAMELLTTGMAHAQTLKVLYSFPGTDGASPSAGVIRDSAGNLYGVTPYTGPYEGGNGTVFKLTPAGAATVLYTFTGGSDGAYPRGSLVRDASGNLYGVTSYGGTLSCNSFNIGCGTIFKVDSSGKETVLYSFPGRVGGETPLGGLLRDSAGNFYGTTQGGGASGGGIVFRLDPNNNLSVLYNFPNDSGNGVYANGDLIRDKSGNLYGTTFWGGTNFCGMVFKISPSGFGSNLHSFQGATDGCSPAAGLMADSAGKLYGTTSGYASINGSAFELSSNGGTTTVLHTFTGNGNDGGNPYSGLVRDSAGNLYGSTADGGQYGLGTIYKIDPSGTETILYNFNGTDGMNPFGTLARDSKGRLYGVTGGGGAWGLGEVFRLTP
jgi:uncharacterized repeat protein (TIGR03803 family)